MPRFDFEVQVRAFMVAAIQSTTASLSTAMASIVAEQVEVVYIPDDGPEKGTGVIQMPGQATYCCWYNALVPVWRYTAALG